MKTFPKLIISLVVFTLLFLLLRMYGQYVFYDVQALVADLGGLTYLYSTVGVIFAIFSASVIIFESQRWDNIIDSIKSEVSELGELWQWSRYAEGDAGKNFKMNIMQYLQNVITNISRKDSSDDMGDEELMISLRGDIFQMAQENSVLASDLLTIFDNFIESRTMRINYSLYHVSGSLKYILFMNSFLLVALSFLIGVKNPVLDYIFLASVVVLNTSICFMVGDMDSPYRIGDWQIKVKDYQKLLESIESTTS